jgi:hypothetical protein
MIFRSLLFLVVVSLTPGLPAQSRILQNDSGQKLPALSSVLSSGKWVKIKVYHDGIYKLSYEDIKDLGFSDPSGIRIFGNGGQMLPLMNSSQRFGDLQENAIFMAKGSDGIFNPGDYVLFYGKGPVSWTYQAASGFFEHTVNPYSDAAYYFVTADGQEGKKITGATEVSGTADMNTTSFTDYNYHERNKYNFLKSGREWFGERIDYSVYDTVFNFPDLVIDQPVKLKSNVLSRSANPRIFYFQNADQVIGALSVPAVILSNSTGIYANQRSGIFNFSATSDQVQLKVSYNKNESSDEGFLDYLTLNVRRKLLLNGNSLFFRDPSATGAGKIASYTVENCNNNTEIWDITDFTNITNIPAQLDGTRLTFRDHADSLKQYVAVNVSGDFPKPEITSSRDDLGEVANQNLHATGPVQMLIVTHPLFREWADSVADFHRLKDNMSVLVVTSDAVYNEFSSGAPDVSAIRDFAKMVYDRSTSNQDRLKYLLLFGDGSYNNLSHAKGNSNYVPTYQSESSLNASTSYVSDDFFGFMGNDEGGAENMEAFSLDLGVGRLPAKNTDEARILYHKIKNYNTSHNMADWRNNILFVGDDEDGNIHSTQANGLADWVRNTHPQYVVKKVLLDAYKQVATSTGARYPEVNRIITENIQKGILIYNYTGHGGERGMAAEQILMREDLTKLSNAGNLPLFVTATCEFSRFDDLTDDEGELIESTSAGESSLLNENGGSIALFSTTRIVYSDRNHYLNTKFYRVVFERDADGHYFKLGDIIRMTKDSSGIQRNKLNFILLGDPALSLALPEFTIQTDSLNGFSIKTATDTLKAFSHVKITGHLEGPDHNPLNTFNGTIYPSVFDKSLTVTTLGNDGGDPLQFETQENLLFKGKASVKQGVFSFEFQVPKDITYSFGNGKIVYYSDDSTDDANGYFNQFIIGGTDTQVLPDNDGPDISLYLNDDHFLTRGISNNNPVIYALISDAGGINTVGNGIGHDITGVVDNNVSDPIILNDYFESDLDDYTRGRLTYPMSDLSDGIHSLKVKVWDVFNNSSERTIEFKVISDEGLILANVYNYPNPASVVTWFRFEHNRPDEELQVTISVFDMEGRNVAVLHQSIFATGFSTAPVEWDLRNTGGNMLRQGVYPYRVRITDSGGHYTDSYNKLIVVKQ